MQGQAGNTMGASSRRGRSGWASNPASSYIDQAAEPTGDFPGGLRLPVPGAPASMNRQARRTKCDLEDPTGVNQTRPQTSRAIQSLSVIPASSARSVNEQR